MWMETPNGSKVHFVPHDSKRKESLCGVQADCYNDNTMSKRKCKRCQKTKKKVEHGNHDEYELHQVR